ncbi:hypothetical protein E2C01_034164 [Portunus trituberculatus]|uniref:Uncharacterized protein n=1 Tax=Portunus trituberculatus TaxID=210409 RepID=A0A5B7F240_PORTR|nr:hypothetical protein [Portunus trituberculatus]
MQYQDYYLIQYASCNLWQAKYFEPSGSNVPLSSWPYPWRLRPCITTLGSSTGGSSCKLATCLARVSLRARRRALKLRVEGETVVPQTPVVLKISVLAQQLCQLVHCCLVPPHLLQEFNR